MRRYNKWAGNPKGDHEDTTQCVVQCHEMRGGAHQCPRKRGHGPDGLYCKQHAKMLAEGRLSKRAVPQDRPA